MRLTKYVELLGLCSLLMLVAGCPGPVVDPGPDTGEISTNIPLPAMVELTGEAYLMGDHAGVGDNDERPVHQVLVPTFSISQYEITFNEYEPFAKASGRAVPDDEGWGRGKRPVVNVSWDDAVAYTEWLSKKTGKDYRLPTESQWEFAARAGALTLFSNGNNAEQVCEVGNIADQSTTGAGLDWSVTACTDGQVYTAEVGGKRPNAYGLYDLHGNVWEWTADCYKTTYQGAPDDGAAVDSYNCAQRVVRGGSFQQPANSARLSNRERLAPANKAENVGFRIVMIQ